MDLNNKGGFATMESARVLIDVGFGGKGYQIIVESGGNKMPYSETIDSLREAYDLSFVAEDTLKSAGVHVSEALITQKAIVANAFLDPDARRFIEMRRDGKVKFEYNGGIDQ